MQNHYNVTNRKHEAVLDYCDAKSISFIPWHPLGDGTLSGSGGPLDPIASALGVTAAQLGIAWLLAHSAVMLPIPAQPVWPTSNKMSALQV